MPYAVSNSPVMESPKPDISVIDVYDLASEIGSEFEKIIDVFGVDAVTSLMRKVINALELLEGMAAKSDQENLTIQDLQARINKLEREKEEKRRFEKVYTLYFFFVSLSLINLAIEVTVTADYERCKRFNLSN